nr:dynamin family protein [Thermolongibacillus altinsuensis]
MEVDFLKGVWEIMVQTTTTQSLQQWVYKLIALHAQLMESGDTEQANKVKQLIQKVHKQEFIIAFCGHFSAGKSSMINELIGSAILPSSPIPTSANLVKVKAGKAYARVFYKHSAPIEYVAPYDYEEIKSFCKDGDAISAIEISHETNAIPKGVVIMDTPGIDSTDDAHRLATESALHLADVIFYMMDYNHVQAELNFEFTKRLTEHGKKLYFIVNQIDKHREEELSFSQFKRSVSQAFQNWNVSIERIFYTSLKQKECSNNDLNALKETLQTIFRRKDERLLDGIAIAVKQIIHDHIRFLEEKDAEKEQHLQQLLQTTDEDQLSREMAEAEEAIKHWEQKWMKARPSFEQELNKIVDNAYIMSYETREKARSFLEAFRDGFKVGFLFTKTKTEEERKRRLQTFYEDLSEKVRSQLEWHIRDLLGRFYREHELKDETLLAKTQQLAVPFSEQLLIELRQNNPFVTGNYLLTYTNDLANELKRRYRLAVLELVDEMIDKGKMEEEKVIQKWREKVERVRKEQQRLAELHTYRLKREQIRTDLLQLMEKKEVSPFSDETIASFVDETFIVRRSEGFLKEKKTIREKKKEAYKEKIEAQDRYENFEQVITQLRRVSELIVPFKGLVHLANEMAEKANRLENRTFTVALFGAFSAGKSSFANALIGEKVLPVSPNPTTATINKIVPPTAERPHGTVVVQMKTNEQLFKDLQHSLRFFGLQANSLEEALNQSKKALAIESVEVKEKVHYAFLKAVVDGYEHMHKDLGLSLFVDFHEFSEYVANETKSCFVEWIELYYDCPLTKQGITLVDTPGADSVNARHTGVAFDYIKNADAILFVTYYNHAFSKADREFLIQLGRVKDAFSLDKMFFIINAADLAQSSEELEAVVEYVEEQLLHFGIRQPRLYPLSSQWALAEKQGIQYGNDVLKNSGMNVFEQQFRQFMNQELAQLVIFSARLQIEQAKKRIAEYIAKAKLSDEAKRAKLASLESERQKMVRIIEQQDAASDLRALEQELSELVYYIKQRIFFRFHDWFKEAFHPSVLHDDHPNIKKALQACLDELLYSIGFDLAQEMRATSLRMEAFLTKQHDLYFENIQKQLKQIHSTLILTKAEMPSFITLEFSVALQQLDASLFKKALSFYKNAKSFFEKDEKRWMKEEIERQLQQPVSNYLRENHKRMVEHYTKQWLHVMKQLHKNMKEQINEHFAGLTAALTEQMPIKELENAYEMIGGIENE